MERNKRINGKIYSFFFLTRPRFLSGWKFSKSKMCREHTYSSQRREEESESLGAEMAEARIQKITLRFPFIEGTLRNKKQVVSNCKGQGQMLNNFFFSLGGFFQQNTLVNIVGHLTKFQLNQIIRTP